MKASPTSLCARCIGYPDERRVEIAIDSELGDDPARWRFWQLRPEADYLLAICAERLDAQVPELIARRAVRLSGEKRLALDFPRTSEYKAEATPIIANVRVK